MGTLSIDAGRGREAVQIHACIDEMVLIRLTASAPPRFAASAGRRISVMLA